MKLNIPTTWFFIIFSTLTFSSFAQEVLIPLQVNPVIKKYRKDHPEKLFKTFESGDTLKLPFKDDFSNYSGYPADSLWDDKDAFVNTGYAYNPYSLGVVTLDAIDSIGDMYYPVAGSSPFIADHLTSKPIDLSPYHASDSIYLSFYYQPQGLGDAPESTDSLILEFYSPLTNSWYPQWKKPGTLLQNFKLVMIPVLSDTFLLKGFKFRFYNYASLTGIFESSWAGNVDMWNLDYIYLNNNRSDTDTIMRDLAFTAPLKSLLRHYEAMPWTHYQNNHSEMNNAFPISFQNNDSIIRNVYRNFSFYDLVNHKITYTTTGGAINFPPFASTTLDVPISYIYDSVYTDHAEFVVTAFFSSTGAAFDFTRNNDTLRYHQVFDNYYAYDDGSSENGYGLSGEGSQNGQLAYQFTNFKTSDTLRGVDMYFNQTLDSVSQKYFFLTIWDNDAVNSQPGSVIYSQIGARPLYEDSLNKFHTYLLDTPQVVPQVFYVGWIQTTTDLLNVGFDRNRLLNDSNIASWKNPKIYFNISGAWQHSSFPGALMIRPLFGKKIILNQITQPLVVNKLTIFPDPAADMVNIRYPELSGNIMVKTTINDLCGKTIINFNTPVQSIDVSHLKNGIYFINISTSQGINYRSKFIVIH
ncbi:MAG: T9SS type A sorting domain-containing protein [Bacteroidia bacterium]|nr:T9SS type A sorting domain-containing protein [Bacteroidia bacterium]